jgi:hypothetical protein
MQTFFLKIPKSFFKAICDRTKSFELLEDKGYQVGDRIVRLEFHESAKLFTGRLAEAFISYKIESSELGLEKGFCVIGMSNVELADVYNQKTIQATDLFQPDSFFTFSSSMKKLYEEGLEYLNKELKEAYAECFLELEDELDSQLEVYLNNDYYYYRQEVA